MKQKKLLSFAAFIKNFLKSVGQVLLATIILFIFLELIFRVLGFPSGADDFVEGVVMKTKLPFRKAKGEMRVFAYGESTLVGAPYDEVSGPIRWLEKYLKEFLPDQDVRIVNFARMGRGSNFTYQTFRDTLAYQPDIAIFYMGHNEFLQDERKDEIPFEDSNTAYLFRSTVQQSRFISAVYREFVKRKIKRKEKKKLQDRMGRETIENQIGDRRATRALLHTDLFYRENLDFFRGNLSKIMKLAEKRKRPVIFMKPVSNIKDFPPIESAHMKNLSSEALSSWNILFKQGEKAEASGDDIGALQFYEVARKIDPTYAELSFRLAKIYLRNGELRDARQYFEEARDNDTIMVRANKDILGVYNDLRKTHRFVYLDTEKVLVSESLAGILGDPVIVDNVHFSIKGHSLTGRALAEEIAAEGWIVPRSEWKFENEKSFSEISNELGVNNEILISAYLKIIDYYGSLFDVRLRTIEKALAIAPNDSRVLRSEAWTYYLMKDEKKAFEIYQKLNAVDPAALQKIYARNPEIRVLCEKFNDRIVGTPSQSTGY
ncbi:MAG: hypothetical protein A3G33_09870 [Omnitrophica bacterium RIFCSPLOWO2_12_FULL_44_17]|uniref:SGNH hydrolase-type esterase domain-containing protein n=1 Tax=Candidatus Danuiimicrobium aquiferis TaxID=1801832 RepID=A0A1G1L136_9BACT|nr:MAG: hypothetical protein A3B72_11140 [Omnitrophica bacterium RIFCSPHIGHO2_02_FULL_45_28]OGW98854.1 MAG: hypothetical protein A3G33_09870 [Omnitrophica bacterium RIFCSPLOWO2_12_FULL_44_17]OGX04101.1 MAG: hypothetical protein A3J12_02235 [Omnitrophica bacterium RIFCSPLOWO2_02_FULL_44_11]